MGIGWAYILFCTCEFEVLWDLQKEMSNDQLDMYGQSRERGSERDPEKKKNQEILMHGSQGRRGIDGGKFGVG